MGSCAPWWVTARSMVGDDSVPDRFDLGFKVSVVSGVPTFLGDKWLRKFMGSVSLATGQPNRPSGYQLESSIYLVIESVWVGRAGVGERFA